MYRRPSDYLERTDGQRRPIALYETSSRAQLLTRDRADLLRPDFPVTSPICDLAKLEQGWDDPTTPPLSNQTLQCAQVVWNDVRLKIAEAGRPDIEPGPGGFVEFTWLSSVEPSKRLILWVYGEPHFYAEYVLENGDGATTDGTLHNLHEVVAIVDEYVKVK